MSIVRGLSIVVPFLALLAMGCVKRMERQVVEPAAYRTVNREAPFLKAHMRDGRLYVWSDWSIDSTSHAVAGTGLLYDANRRITDRGAHRVDLDSVALFETNVVRASPSVAIMGLVTGISAGVTVFCLTNTKACFGSCPTFYAFDGRHDRLQAEGFSASVAPSLEARDVDALYRARAQDGILTLRMVNEAYETHVVRSANLLVVPREPGTRIVTDEGHAFWSVDPPLQPLACVGPEGDCLDGIASFDERERFSLADSTDLATRETVELAWNAPPGGKGQPAIMIASRQSLLQTYLLYQTFAYLGGSVGEWLAKFERGDPLAKRHAGSLVSLLGGIDVLVPDRFGRWRQVGRILETGPLAADVKIVRLPRGSDPTRVRLRMARGAWRIDYVALTTVTGAVEPQRLAPREVFHRGTLAVDARRRLLDPDEALVTFPGDEYTLVYRLPDASREYEFFLESQGYYLEWMREEWIAEENPLEAARLFLDPAGSLKRLAPRFKRVESDLENAFWRSKYAGL